MRSQTHCGVLGCRGAARYHLGSGPHGGDVRCGWHGLVYRPVAGRALRVALVVGTVLVAINQSDVILGGHLTTLVAAKIGLTYLVPFSVSTYSALGANRLRGS